MKMDKIACFNVCTVKAGKREELIEKAEKAGLLTAFRAQKGCQYYFISMDTDDADKLVLNDGWSSQETFDAHVASPEVQTWYGLCDEYVIAQTPVVSTFRD